MKWSPRLESKYARIVPTVGLSPEIHNKFIPGIVLRRIYTSRSIADVCVTAARLHNCGKCHRNCEAEWPSLEESGLRAASMGRTSNGLPKSSARVVKKLPEWPGCRATCAAHPAQLPRAPSARLAMTGKLAATLSDSRLEADDATRLGRQGLGQFPD